MTVVIRASRLMCKHTNKLAQNLKSKTEIFKSRKTVILKSGESKHLTSKVNKVIIVTSINVVTIVTKGTLVTVITVATIATIARLLTDV